MTRLRRLISSHLLVLGAIYIADGAVLHNPAYVRQGALIPLATYGLVLLLTGLILLWRRDATVYAMTSAVYVALAVSFWGAWTAVVTYLWLAILVTMIGRLDNGR